MILFPELAEVIEYLRVVEARNQAADHDFADDCHMRLTDEFDAYIMDELLSELQQSYSTLSEQNAQLMSWFRNTVIDRIPINVVAVITDIEYVAPYLIIDLEGEA